MTLTCHAPSHNLSLSEIYVAGVKGCLTSLNTATRGCVARSDRRPFATNHVAVRSRLTYQAFVPLTCTFIHWIVVCYVDTWKRESLAKETAP